MWCDIFMVSSELSVYLIACTKYTWWKPNVGDETETCLKTPVLLALHFGVVGYVTGVTCQNFQVMLAPSALKFVCKLELVVSNCTFTNGKRETTNITRHQPSKNMENINGRQLAEWTHLKSANYSTRRQNNAYISLFLAIFRLIIALRPRAVYACKRGRNRLSGNNSSLCLA